jgi:hypothetical protein
MGTMTNSAGSAGYRSHGEQQAARDAALAEPAGAAASAVTRVIADLAERFKTLIVRTHDAARGRYGM